MRVYGYVALPWLLQALGSVGSLCVGTYPGLGWPIFVGFLILLRRSAQLTIDELHSDRVRALVLCLLGQLPAVLLAGYVGLCFLRSDPPMVALVALQLWTSVWSPVLALVPPVLLADRALYLWVTLAIPALQTVWILEPFWLTRGAGIERRRYRAVRTQRS